MRKTLQPNLFNFLKHGLCEVCSGILVEMNWALSVDQCWLQALQFSVHLIDLLSLLLTCNGFPGIQKAVVDQTGSRPPNSDHDLFWCKFGFGKFFGVSSQSRKTELIITSRHIKSSFYCTSQSDREMVCCFLHRITQHFKMFFFFFFFVVAH